MTTAIDRHAAPSLASRRYWLFSAPVDLAAFLGSALLSLALLAWGAAAGWLSGDTPEWAWVPLVLMIDVAHVYATGFRVYFDRAEVTRRPWLYGGVPAAAWLAGMALYQWGELPFWRVLAYLAVFHFVRQQYGWVALYRRRLGEPRGWESRLDALTIYLATLYPLLYWHAHLPRRFWWFLEGDFGNLPGIVADLAAPLYWGVLTAYAVRAVQRWWRGTPNPGKDIVVATTAVCWHVGIITFNSDYAFTVTNVIIHGIPYMVLVYWYMRRGSRELAAGQSVAGQAVAGQLAAGQAVAGQLAAGQMAAGQTVAGQLAAGQGTAGQGTAGGRWIRGNWMLIVQLLGTVWLLAYAEELLWDRAIWQERSWLFGVPLDVGSWDAVLVPLLAVPQLTHYVLDGFIWRRRGNPNFRLDQG